MPATFVSALSIIVFALLALALQQSVSNFAATVSFLMFQPFRRDELVETMGHTGTVREILLFTTVLHLPDDRLVTLSNSQIQGSGIVNYSRMGRVRADVAVTVAFGEDLRGPARCSSASPARTNGSSPTRRAACGRRPR